LISSYRLEGQLAMVAEGGDRLLHGAPVAPAGVDLRVEQVEQARVAQLGGQLSLAGVGDAAAQASSCSWSIAMAVSIRSGTCASFACRLMKAMLSCTGQKGPRSKESNRRGGHGVGAAEVTGGDCEAPELGEMTPADLGAPLRREHAVAAEQGGGLLDDCLVGGGPVGGHCAQAAASTPAPASSAKVDARRHADLGRTVLPGPSCAGRRRRHGAAGRQQQQHRGSERHGQVALLALEAGASQESPRAVSSAGTEGAASARPPLAAARAVSWCRSGGTGS
jgi:hypothetical protein